MGMKPREKAKLKINKSTREGIATYGEGLRILLKKAKVPQDKWSDIWNNLDDYPKADADHDIQWFVGWFTGVTETLGANFEDLIVL
jgi:hypothetical protein